MPRRCCTYQRYHSQICNGCYWLLRFWIELQRFNRARIRILEIWWEYLREYTDKQFDQYLEKYRSWIILLDKISPVSKEIHKISLHIETECRTAQSRIESPERFVAAIARFSGWVPREKNEGKKLQRWCVFFFFL